MPTQPTGSSSGLAAGRTPAPPSSSASSAAPQRRLSSTTPSSGISGPAVIACLVIGLGLCLNLMNLGFLTLDHSSTHDYHMETITHVLGFGEGGKHHIRIKDDDEDTDAEGGGEEGPDDDDINLDDDKVLGKIEKVEDLLDADESTAAVSGHLDEVHAFKRVLSRAVANLEVCNSLPKVKGPPTKEVQQITDTPMLAEFGIVNALSEWIGKVEGEKNANDAAGQQRGNNANDEAAYPVCHLPPASSCQTKTYSVVLMSHATDRLKKLKGGVVDLCGRDATEEVILVWNSPKSLLESDSSGIGQELLRWDEDPSHKMRIFFALENGLENNLLNRYHPSIQPESEAVMYFDDDGPFFDERAMSKVGFELWKRNSDVQNAAFPRNLRVLSDRMKDMQKQGLGVYLKNILDRSKDGKNSDAGEGETDDVPFTPTCRERTGDIIEYNYFVFPQFGANMALPSGSIIHRNYLCFIWHPAFEELRTYIREHPTHPDDQTVSAIISQLSGKPPRAFPRIIKEGNTEDKANLRGAGEAAAASSKATNSTKRRRLLSASEEESIDNDFLFTTIAEEEEEVNRLHVDQDHRRLLWQQKNWGPMREEAANSLIGYFGSLNAGSVGWCAGTQYQKTKPRSPGGYSCDPEFPTLDMVPWIKPSGVGYDICKD